MKSEIFGRKVGSEKPFSLLITSEGARCSNPEKADPWRLQALEESGLRRNVELLQAHNVEGYVLRGGVRYTFTPGQEFVL